MMSGPDSTSEPPHTRLRRRAMDFLARREHTFAELEQKLTERCPDDDPHLIRSVLEGLREDNLQSDERFIEAFMHHRLRTGSGPVKLSFELRGKGVSESDITEALEHIPAENWVSSAVTRLQKKYRVKPGGVKEKQQAWRFLQQRGFDSETIRQAMVEAWPNSEN